MGNQADSVPKNPKTVDTTLVGDTQKNAPTGNSNWQELVKQANSLSRDVPSEESASVSTQARVTVKVIFDYLYHFTLIVGSKFSAFSLG